MTKQELEQAIKNGESAWYVDNCNDKIWEIDLNKKYKPEIYLDQILYIYQNTNDKFKQELFIENIYKTKAEAEHYLHHANITRTEQLPFLTWEEFKNGKELKFNGLYADELIEYRLVRNSNMTYIILLEDEDEDETWVLTEENFYKAYDECVRLFRGGK